MLNFPALDAAIARAEGFGTAGNIPTFANNPGDLIAGPFPTAHGATSSVVLAANGQQIAVFPDLATGTAAEDALLSSSKYSGVNYSDLAKGWLSGSDPTKQTNWANTVAKTMGVPVTSIATPPIVSAPSAGGGITGPLSAADTLARWLDEKLGTQYPGEPGPGAQTAPITLGRIAALILGLIVIAGAIFLFKPAQEVVRAAVRR